MEFHNCERHNKNNYKEHIYTNFDVSRKQHLRYQSNKNCNDLIDCMAQPLLLMHQIVAASLRSRTNLILLFFSKNKIFIELLHSFEHLDEKKFKESYAKFSSDRKLFLPSWRVLILQSAV